MKVEFITSYFKPYRGGIENVVEHLAQGLSKKGHTVVVHTSNLAPGTKIALPVTEKTDNYVIKRYTMLPYSLFFPKFIYKDSIISMHNYSALMNDYVTFFNKKRKKILTPYGTITYDKSQRQHLYLSSFYDLLLGKRTLHEVDTIIPMTDYEKIEIAKKYPELQRKLHVVGAGIDLPEKITKKKNPYKYKYFLSIGRVSHTKRFEDAVSILSKFPDYHYVFAGKDIGHAERILTMAREKKIENKVHYLGEISEEKKIALLMNCSVFIMSSSAEAFSIASLEAFYYTGHVVGANSGGIIDLYNQFGGEVYPIGNTEKMIEAIKISLGKKITDNDIESNRKKIRKEYSWESVVDAYEKIIKQ